jgi:hypothetical protein
MFAFFTSRNNAQSNSKGAFQLSLGFIVGVVFAIVLLSLAVVWIQGLIGDITIVTDDLTQEGKNAIRDAFKSTQTNFAVYPDEWELERGHSLRLLAGVINRHQDSSKHNFVVNVFPQTPADRTWFTETDFYTPLPTEFNAIVEFPITIEPPADAPAGTYVFRIITCMDTSFAQCSQIDDMNYGGSPQYLRVTLK